MDRSAPPTPPAAARAAGRERRRARRHRGGFVGFIGKYFLLFCLLVMVIVVVDLFLYVAVTIYGMQGSADETTGPTQLSTRVCAALERQDDGSWELSPDMEARLDQEGVWAFLLDAEGDVAWKSKSMPDDAALPQTAQDVALIAHYGSLQSRPAFVYTPADNAIVDASDADTPQSDDSAEGEANVGSDTLLVLTYPEGSRVVFPTTSFTQAAFGSLGTGIAVILLADLAILFVAYAVSRRSMFRSIEPISDGIGKLAKGEPVSLEAQGDLADIADDVNAASDVIRAKDNARANWISGVSHDVRTPLSMVMGYADRIAENPEVPERSRTEASIIRAQSMKMRDLVEDLNLASKLEYDLQPMDPEALSPAALLRATVAEFADAADPDLYELDVDVDARAEHVRFRADRRLLGRAVRNLLQNAVTHNPQGCRIAVSLGIADASGLSFPARSDRASCETSKAHDKGTPPASSERTGGKSARTEDDGKTKRRARFGGGRRDEETAHAGTAWYVRVADDGVGVPADVLVTLQNGPASLGDAAQRRGDGIAAHGLGLLLVRGITRVHGGTVLFASDGVGKGFSATLAFPFDQA